MSSFTPILNLPQVAPNQEQKETTINTALAILEAGFNDVRTYDITAADYTLTTDDFTKYFFHKFTGHVVARTITVPQTPRWFACKNEGTAPITVTTANGGQTFNLGAGKRALLASDGTDVEAIVPDPSAGVGLLGDLSDVQATPPSINDVLQWDGSIWKPSALNIAFSFTQLNDTPNSFSGAAGRILQVNATGSGIEFVTSAANINDFIDLGDTPSSYLGQNSRHVRVNSTGTGLIFQDLRLTQAVDFPSSYAGAAGRFVVVNPASNGLTFSEAAFLALSDTPSDYAGQEGRFLRVRADGAGLEFNTGVAGPDNFNDLTDTPASYATNGGKILAVSATEDGIVYGAGFLDLEDTPNSYGAAGQVLVVNGTGDGTEFKALDFVDLANTPANYVANAFVRVNPGGTGLIYGNPTFLSLADTPSAFAGNEGSYLQVKLDGSGIQFVNAPTFTTNFLALSDTPATFAGQAGKAAIVNGTENGLIFANIASSFSGLTDTPNSYAGAAGYSLRVNGAGTGIEFVQDGDAASFIIPADYGLRRFWRIRFTEVNAGAPAPVWINDIELRDVNGVDRTDDGLGSITASSQAGSNPPTLAFDNNAGTQWRSSGNVGGGATQWIAYDFGAGRETALASVVVTAEGSNSPESFDVQYSDDGLSWTTAWSVSGESGWPAAPGEERAFSAPATPGVALRTLQDGPNSYLGQGGKLVRINQAENGFEFGLLAFSELDGVPELSTNQGRALRINAGGTALEAYDPITRFLSLSDTPASFTGTAGYRVKVNSAANALTFVADTLANMTDTDFSSAPTNGDVLAYNGVSGRWEPSAAAGGGGASLLGDLNDVDFSTPPGVGDYLVLGASGQWVPTSIGFDLGELNDVDFSTAPSDSQVLLYDSLTSSWIAGDLSIDSLTDVDLTGVAVNDFLRYDGSSFVPYTLVMSGISDVDLSTAPTDGQVLAYHALSSTWRPTTVSTGGGGGAATLNELTDVDTSTTPPLEGQVLEFDSGSGLWVPADRGTVYTRTGSLAIVNGDFENAIDLFGWATTKGSPGVGTVTDVAALSGQTQYLIHANNDAQDYEVEQTVAIPHPGYPGEITIDRYVAANFAPIEDLPYIEVGFLDGTGTLIGSYDRRAYTPPAEDTWFRVSEKFACPANAVDMVLRVGGIFVSGTITNAQTDLISGTFIKYVTGAFDLLAVLPSLIGNAGYTLVVNPTEDGVQWAPSAGGGSSSFIALSDTPAAYSGASGLLVRVNTAGDALEFTTFSMSQLDDVSEERAGNANRVLAVSPDEATYVHVDRTADVGFFFAGTSEDGEIMARYACARAFTVSASGHVGVASIPATSSATYSLRRNGAQFGTMTFASASGTATFSVSSTTFNQGDVLEVIAPATADASLSDIAFTLQAKR